MPQPASVEAAASDILAELARAQATLTAEWERLQADPGRWRRRNTLRGLLDQVDADMRAVEASAAEWLSSEIPGVYRAGAEVGGRFVWNAAHRHAVEQFAADTFAEIRIATNGVRADARRFGRDAARSAVRGTLLEGETAQQSARRFARELAKVKQITSVRYADGSRRGIGDYGDMLVRTKSATAYNSGTINQTRQDGTEILLVSDGLNCFGAGTDYSGVGGTRSMTRSWCSGKSVLRVTVEGIRHPLTVGPNHPILTPTGWRPAQSLNPGDDLLCSSRTDLAEAGLHDHLQEVPTRADEMFASLGEPTRRVATRNDLHGDAHLGNGEVEVVAVDRPLLLPPSVRRLRQMLRQVPFVGSDMALVPVLGDRSLGKIGVRSFAPLRRLVCSLDLMIAFFSSCMSPLVGRRTGSRAELPATDLDPALLAGKSRPQFAAPVEALVGAEPALGVGHRSERLSAEFADRVRRWPSASDGGAFAAAVDPMLRRDGVEDGSADGTGVVDSIGGSVRLGASAGAEGPVGTFAGVPAVEALGEGLSWGRHVISSVEVVEYRGWLYDAESASGLLLLDGILAKNCGWTSHDDKDLAHGKLVTLDEANEYPVSHANCRRAFSPRPDLTVADAGGRDSLTTPEQDADQLATEQAREAANQRRAARKARTARQARSPRVNA